MFRIFLDRNNRITFELAFSWRDLPRLLFETVLFSIVGLVIFFVYLFAVAFVVELFVDQASLKSWIFFVWNASVNVLGIVALVIVGLWLRGWIENFRLLMSFAKWRRRIVKPIKGSAAKAA